MNEVNNPTMIDTEYITTKEAAKILGVSRYHIAYLARTNHLQSMRHSDPLYGGRFIILILKSSVLDYKENKSNRGRPPGHTSP